MRMRSPKWFYVRVCVCFCAIFSRATGQTRLLPPFNYFCTAGIWVGGQYTWRTPTPRWPRETRHCISLLPNGRMGFEYRRVCTVVPDYCIECYVYKTYSACAIRDYYRRRHTNEIRSEGADKLHQRCL